MLKTRITGLALLALLGVLTSGCSVPSVHPLYTEGDVVAQPAVVGMWVSSVTSSGETWKFFKKPDANAYTLVHTIGGVPAWFDVHFTRIGEAVYMDTWFASENDEKSGTKQTDNSMNMLEAFHLIPGHLFWRVEMKGPVLTLAMLSPDRLREQLDAGTVSVGHEYQETPDDQDPTLILTASTAQLREFVLKSADRVFSNEPWVLQRKPAKSAQASLPGARKELKDK